MAFVSRLGIRLKPQPGFCVRRCSSETPAENTVPETQTSEKKPPLRQRFGFKESFKLFANLSNTPEEPVAPQSFASLLRQSSLIQLGDPAGKVVEGTIFHVVEDDLYVDFGGKFHCVVRRPQTNSAAYVRRAKVKVQLNQLELSTKFLGASKEITLKEADVNLIGLILSKPASGKL